MSTGQQLPQRIGDLKPWARNPRAIDEPSRAGLRASLNEFGDISGIVYHLDGYLICGHQRVRELEGIHGDDSPIEWQKVADTGDVATGAVVLRNGERFRVRVVDWEEAKAQAANVAANSGLLSGSFTADLLPLLEELSVSLPDLSEALRLPELRTFTLPLDNQDINEDELAQTSHECPKCGFKW